MVRASLAIATLIAAAPAPVTRAGGAPSLGVAAWTPVILLERSGPSSDTSDALFADATSAAASEWGPPPRPRRVPRPRPLAGPLVLLYAQPLTRIVTVTTTDVVLAADRVQLRLGRTLSTFPNPSPRCCGCASTCSTRASGWLSVGRDVAPDPARRRSLLADHDHWKALHRPRLVRQDAPDLGPVRPSAG